MKKKLDAEERFQRDLRVAQCRFVGTIDQIERLRGRPRVAASLALCLSLETAIKHLVDSIRDLYDSMYDE